MSKGLEDAFIHAGHGLGNTYLGKASIQNRLYPL